jgi:hypothetical protein
MRKIEESKILLACDVNGNLYVYFPPFALSLPGKISVRINGQRAFVSIVRRISDSFTTQPAILPMDTLKEWPYHITVSVGKHPFDFTLPFHETIFGPIDGTQRVYLANTSFQIPAGLYGLLTVRERIEVLGRTEESQRVFPGIWCSLICLHPHYTYKIDGRTFKTDEIKNPSFLARYSSTRGFQHPPVQPRILQPSKNTVSQPDLSIDPKELQRRLDRLKEESYMPRQTQEKKTERPKRKNTKHVLTRRVIKEKVISLPKKELHQDLSDIDIDDSLSPSRSNDPVLIQFPISYVYVKNGHRTIPYLIDLRIHRIHKVKNVPFGHDVYIGMLEQNKRNFAVEIERMPDKKYKIYSFEEAGTKKTFRFDPSTYLLTDDEKNDSLLLDVDYFQ